MRLLFIILISSLITATDYCPTKPPTKIFYTHNPYGNTPYETRIIGHLIKKYINGRPVPIMIIDGIDYIPN